MMRCHRCEWKGSPENPVVCPNCDTKCTMSIVEAEPSIMEVIMGIYDDCPSARSYLEKHSLESVRQAVSMCNRRWAEKYQECLARHDLLPDAKMLGVKGSEVKSLSLGGSFISEVDDRKDILHKLAFVDKNGKK